MKALLLSEGTRRDIDSQVAKVLRGLGNPEPPLDLRLVRELLRLDRGYYSKTDASAVRDTVSRMRVAGKQVIQRPTLLLEAIRKLSLRALYLPDQRRILIDIDLPPLKHRWNEAHEIGHSIIPWHQGLMGDDDLTLIQSCHEIIEAEANFTAGQLLFFGKRFHEEACSLTPGLAAIDRLTTVFGNTKTSTLWRYVELAWPETPIVGVISCHPHIARRGETFDEAKPCRHIIGSPAFAARFGSLTDTLIFTEIARYCGAQRGGILGEDDVILSDDHGGNHIFHFETFFNRYEALTLGVYLRPQSPIIVVR